MNVEDGDGMMESKACLKNEACFEKRNGGKEGSTAQSCLGL